jgi:hypothetical protein
VTGLAGSMTTDTRAPISAPTGIAGWWAGRSSRQKRLVAIAIVSLFVLVPLRGLFRRQGPPMEEGFMLVFAERVLAGDVPNVDFLHLYGPGSLWVLAGVFKVFGVSLWAERVVALVQQLGIIFGVFALARHWGRTAAVLCATTTLLIVLPPAGLAALAWNGGLALGLWGVVVGLDARRGPRDSAGLRPGLAALAGLLFGLALLYRLDLVVAVGLAIGVLAWRMPRPWWLRLGAGLGLGLAPYAIHVARAGIGASIEGMVLEPVFDLRGGRALPLPPTPDRFYGFLNATGDLDALDWPFPRLWSPAQLTAWFFFLLFVVAVLAAVGLWRVRRDPSSFTAWALLAGAAFSTGLLPQALQRADTTHMAWVSCVPIGLLPLAVLEVLRAVRPGWAPRTCSAAAGGGVLVFLFIVIPNFTVRDYLDISLQSFDVHRLSYEIRHDGRTFYYGRADVPAALAELLPTADAIAEPGDRLFVGPSDLRKTPYSDAFLYYLLSDTVPATHYIEMDPGVANAEDSGLADDLASADVVILSRVWDNWDEPNDSRVAGPDDANEVLRAQFCLVGEYGGLYRLYRRCDK